MKYIIHKQNRILALVALSFVCCGLSSAESLIAPGSEVEKLHGEFGFIEGPVADAEGNVYFSDIPNNRTHVWSIDGKLSTFREDTGGANGLNFDRDGNLLACEGAAQRITSIDPQGKVSVVVDSYDGKRLNSPNDLWFDAKGGFYFTDPNYGSGRLPLEQDGEHVYYVSPDRSNVTRVVDDMKKPNGVVGSLDGKKLYVADTSGQVFVFDVNDDATLSNKKLFAPQGSDGMTLDERGNLYLTWLPGVTIYSPDGEELEVIKVPEMPANVGFGGPGGNTLFITARTSLYAIQMNVKGYPRN